MRDHRFRVKYDWLPSSLCCMFECLGVYPWVGVLLVCECTCVWGVLAHVHTCALCVEARGWYWLSSSLALHLICRHGLLLNPELTDSASLLIQISLGWGTRVSCFLCSSSGIAMGSQTHLSLCASSMPLYLECLQAISQVPEYFPYGAGVLLVY